jgi:para-aminobenzoate synthetase component 1
MSSARAGLAPNERWVGFIAYDVGRLFESLPSCTRDDLQTPLFAFAKVGPGGDSVTGEITPAPRPQRAELRSTFRRRDYLAAVERVIEYIRAGDVFQVNLSQRFTLPASASPAEVYSRLLGRSPAWYGGLLDFGDFALACNSPELFLRVTPQPDGSRRVVTRPIKGTRPRGAGMERELRQSMKDQAELNMIVDLERNDLGRICEIGSVVVTVPRVIETHPTVYHGAATIEGALRPEVTFVDLLRATLPGGSVTGAPKIRAMQIIEELEPTRRGPYCGAIGYVAADGSIEFNVAIRTIILKDGFAHIPVGGGVVADSDPAAEYEETLVKARAMFEALGVSGTDL